MEVDGVHNMKAYFRNEQTSYDIDKGWTYTRNANETLDSAVIRISHLTTKLDIQPFDNVRIENDSDNPILNFNDEPLNILYLCVDSYQETQASLDPVFYNYEIHLFSETKKLENVILPNLSITPKKLSTPLTIRKFIKQIWDIYKPIKRISNGWGSLYTFDTDSLPSRFDSVCPEKQWTTPTLRDILNDLFMVCDCIPTMVNNQIGFLDLTTINNTITNYNFITRSRSSQDYATDLKMSLQNVMQETYTIKTYEHLSFTSDSFIVNDSNLILKTQYPILNIKHLWVTWCSSQPFYDDRQNKHTIFIKSDLCNLKLKNDTQTYSLVKEKKLFDVLNVVKYANVISTTSVEPYSKCKNYCLYYNRGSNEIRGFDLTNKIDIFSSTMPLLAIILGIAELDGLLKLGVDGTQTIGGRTLISGFNLAQASMAGSWFFPTFEIEYETSKEVVFSAGKKELLRNERTIMDNQTNAWVNATAQGNLEYQKANRTGNEVVMINQRCADSDKPINIFDHLGNEIVYQTEYQIFDNYVDVNAYATKDYILRDYFTGINSKIRTWVNAQEEAFIRHDLYKYYVEFDEAQYKNDKFNDNLNYLSIDISYLCSPLYTNISQPLRYCVVCCDQFPEIESRPYTVFSFVLNFVSRVIGNSIVLTWGFNDNYVGLKMLNIGAHSNSDLPNVDGIIAKSDFSAPGIIPLTAQSDDGYAAPPHYINNNINGLGGLPLQAFKYCDDEGNFNFMYTAFYDELPNLSIENGDLLTKDKYWELLSNQLVNINLRAINITPTPIFYFSSNVRKDNKEIINASLQFEYVSNSNSIYIYDNFISMQDMVRTGNKQGLAIYAAPNSSAIPALVSDGQVVLTKDGNSINVRLLGTLPDLGFYYICNGDINTPLIRTRLRSFYINLLRKRDKTGL